MLEEQYFTPGKLYKTKREISMSTDPSVEGLRYTRYMPEDMIFLAISNTRKLVDGVEHYMICFLNGNKLYYEDRCTNESDNTNIRIYLSKYFVDI